jgi:hypothetical protein
MKRSEFLSWLGRLKYAELMQLIAACADWAGHSHIVEECNKTLTAWRSFGSPDLPENVVVALHADLCVIADSLGAGIVRIIGRKLCITGA